MNTKAGPRQPGPRPGLKAGSKQPGPRPGQGRGMKDIGVQVGLGQLPTKRRSAGSSCVRCSLWTVGIVVGVLATLPVWNTARDSIEMMWLSSDFMVGPEMMDNLGMEGVSLFKQHDRDDDGKLSLGEFEPIAHRLLQLNETYNYEIAIEESDEVITIESEFKPLVLESMTKKEEDSFTGGLDPLRGLKFWKSPVHEWQNFAVSHLQHFIPLDPYMMEDVGEVYDIISPVQTDATGVTLSSNRYLPPPLMGDREIMLHRLLAMFHPKPFVYSRFGPQGTVAVVRAQNQRYVDIVFRAHGEFQLNEPPFAPYWFTPAQFTGRLIVSKDATRVLYFNMFVPADRRLNVDMEWLNGQKKDDMEVDIGFMPQMSLRATRTSIHAFHGGSDIRDKFIDSEEDYESSLERIQWKQEIPLREASRLLETRMYPFKKVDYHNLTAAFAVAREQQKPVHSILLWGALDDQSC